MESEIEAGILRSSVDAVNVLVDECRAKIEEEGINIKAVDPANVGMVELNIPKDSFDKYNQDGELVGLNLDKLEEVVKMANKGDFINLDLEEETGKLNISMDGLKYSLSLIDPNSIEEPDVPDLELGSEVVVAGQQVKRGIKAAGMVSDHMSFRVSESFYMSAEGETDEVNLELGDKEVISIESDEEVESMFSLDYLQDMAKAIPGDSEVRLEIGDDHPIKMNFSLGGGKAKVTYLLAPRIES